MNNLPNLEATLYPLYESGYALFNPEKSTYVDEQEISKNLLSRSEAQVIVAKYDNVLKMKPGVWPNRDNVKEAGCRTPLKFYNIKLGTLITIRFKGDYFEQKLYLSGNFSKHGPVSLSTMLQAYRPRVMARFNAEKQKDAVAKAIQHINQEVGQFAEEKAKKEKLKDFLKPTILAYNDSEMILGAKPFSRADIENPDFISDLTLASVNSEFKMGDATYRVYIIAKENGEVSHELRKVSHGLVGKTPSLEKLIEMTNTMRCYEDQCSQTFKNLQEQFSGE